MNRLRIIIPLALAIAAAALVHAHVETLVPNGMAFHTLARATGVTIQFKHNTQSQGALGNVESGSNPIAAVDAAIATIATASGVNYVDAGTSATTDAASDGLNLVTFANTAGNVATVGGAVAVDVFFYNTSTFQITESDMVFNPSMPFSSLGSANFQDIQNVATHEAGHSVGLDHSPMIDSTMFPFGPNGFLLRRTLNSDDVAGLKTLYPNAPGGLRGIVTGTVQRAPGQPVGGGHLVLQDVITGRLGTGSVSVSNGSFTIAGVAAGLYNLIAEPLDGPFVPANLSSSGWGSTTFDTTFRTTILGGATPTPVVVKPGLTTNVGTFTVTTTAPTLNVTTAFQMATATGGFSFVQGTPAGLTPPYTQWLGILGTLVNTAPDAAFGFNSPFITITGPNTQNGTAGAAGYKIFPLNIPASAPPGPYAVRVTLASGEIAIAPGLVEVKAPATLQPFTASFGAGCPGPGGAVTLNAPSPPSVGNAAFNLHLTNTVVNDTAYWFLSAYPDSFIGVPGCTVNIDLNVLLVPFITSGVFGTQTSLALPIPNSPGLAGVDVYAQVATIGVVSGLRVSNALQIHIQ